MTDRSLLELAAAALLIVAATHAPAAEMKYPDFESQWRNPTAGRGGNPWDTTKPMGLGQEAPRRIQTIGRHHHPALQDAQRTFDNAHVLVGNPRLDAGLAQQRFDKRDENQVVGAEQFFHAAMTRIKLTDGNEG